MSALPALFGHGRRGLLAGLIVNGLGQAALAVAASLLVREAFDQMVMTPPALLSAAVLWPAAGIAVCALLAGVLRVHERVLAERLGQHYVLHVRHVLFDHLSAIPARALQGRARGGLVLRFIGDMNALRQWVSLGVAHLVNTALVAGGVLVALACLNVALATAVAVAVTLGGLLGLSRGGALRAASRTGRRRMAKLAAHVHEQINAQAVVQASGQSERERRRLGRLGARLRDATVARARVGGEVRAITDITAAGAQAMALLVGGQQVAAGQASVGTVVVAMSIIGVLLPPLRGLGRVQQHWHGAQVALTKLADFLRQPAPLVARTPSRDKPPRAEGRLALRGVTVRGALDGIDAVAAAGQVIAIVGPNGAGKSTLLGVAARLFDPDAGQVELDGRALHTLPLRALRRAIGIASADLPLLRGSVRRNLCYRHPRVAAEEFARVIVLCGIDQLVGELPAGFDTRLGDGGLGLSAGQRQRIALARAIMGGPAVLLLDEADANLDGAASAVLDRVIARQGATTLIVTHRRERVLAADAVWFMEGGRIVETGTPASLLAGDTRTARLFAPLRVAAA